MPERALWLALVYTAIMAAIVARLFQLQVVDGERWAGAVDEQREVSELLPPKRGRILDRHGTALADNRAAYQAAVVLTRLAVPRKQRRTWPVLALDEAAFDRLIADLGLRLAAQTPTLLRATVLRELLEHPAVAFRRSATTRDTALTLLALPGVALAPDEDGAQVAAELATSDLVHEDPRAALRREVALRWQEDSDILLPEELAAAADALDRAVGSGLGRCLTVLDTFAPTVALRLEGEGEAAPRIELRLLTASRRREAETALARFLSRDPRQVAGLLADALAAARREMPSLGHYFAAKSQALEIATLLPPGRAFFELPLDGVPPASERVILIQGPRPGAPAGEAGLYQRLQRRLGASLGIDGDIAGALIERHAARIRVAQAERLYRGRMLLLDHERLARLCVGLSQELGANGVPMGVPEIEKRVAEARRIADKEWAGQGHDDPIVLLPDIPHRLALQLERAASTVPTDVAKRFDGTESRLPGLAVRVASTREYPFGDTACHTVGTLARVGAGLGWDEALGKGLDPGGWLGASGLEKTYDAMLRGVVGRRVLMHGSDGARVIGETPAVPGRDLRTELDLELQQAAERALDSWFELAQQLGTADAKMDAARKVGRGRAGMVVIDCDTGGILALASSPRYHPAELGARWKELTADPREPLHDHAAEGAQPPGSALKILTALAALEHQVITPDTVIETKGYMAMIAGKKVLRSHAPAGSYDLIRSIQVSDNCYFATIGARMGGEKLAEYFRRFGIGERVALDVAQQKPGLLPTPETLRRLQKRKWTTSDTWRLSIGQFSTSSPLQVVTIAAAVANGGHVVAPYLVRPRGGPEVKDVHVRADWLEKVRKGMEAVTAPGGTARSLALGGDLAGIEVAAKTGTSEWGNIDQTRFPDHSWLIGYAPADDPRIAFAIFVHSGTSGGRASSPIAKKVLEAYFAKYGRAGHARLFDEE